jgi:hypothetical protein
MLAGTRRSDDGTMLKPTPRYSRRLRRLRARRVSYATLVARVRSGSRGAGTIPWRRLRAKDVPLMFW